ncbi:GGDEF domain-containing protein [Shewanella waksmanii]|uniref:GGDEF domain-containing protein n=1 Tax=Shewanella waksmanii TaxID=213783 RepID=UPI000490AC24|nr:GGDEF domain-containing protein [Shewanella waksmanii]
MLAQQSHDNLWLREQDHPAINLPRWQQQVDILSEFYQAQSSVIVQKMDDDFQIVCSRQKTNFGLYGGEQFQDAELESLLTSYTGYGIVQSSETQNLSLQLRQFEQLIILPLYWPDGFLFGAIIICQAKQLQYLNKLLPLLETAKSLIQGELKQLHLMQQVQMLSVQDEQTCMLNPYGFSLMAPRQLSLSRRFGSHAGIILLEDIAPQASETQLLHEQKLRQIARIVHDNLRDADVSARIGERMFIILAFVDNESNLSALINRLKKQIAKESIKLNVVTGQSYFTPNTHQSLEPMQKAAMQNLADNKEKLLNIKL